MLTTQTTYAKLVDATSGTRDHFHIPKYQREYTWGKSQWERLLADIHENHVGYFMGSIICVYDSQSAAPGSEHIFEVIDGQQRLTTLSLLLAAIYNKLKDFQQTISNNESEDFENLNQELQSIRSRLVKTQKTSFLGTTAGLTIGSKHYLLRVQPSTQHHNLDDMRYILSSLGIIEKIPYPAQHGNRLFARAFKYFGEHIPATFEDMQKLIERINQLCFVQITVPNQADAFALFESLNNRGIPLSAMDIVKNKMLSKLEHANVSVDDSYVEWQRIIEALPEAFDQERFLRHFYNALKIHSHINVDGIPRATQSQVIRIYEKLIERDATKIFAALIEAAEVYGKLTSVNYSDAVNEKLLELERIGSAPAYMVLLYLFLIDTNDIVDSGTFYPECIEMLCKYYIRRNVTDSPPTRQIDLAMMKVIAACEQHRNAGNKLTVEDFSSILKTTGELAPLSTFESALQANMYESNSGMTRYLLIQLDGNYHHREYQPDLWQRNKKQAYIWTVEHVIPQTTDLNANWVTMIGQGDLDIARQVQATYLHTLGNLTLSAYNSRLSARSFEQKQEKTSERLINGQEIYTGYRNKLALNELKYSFDGKETNLAETRIWTAEQIASRTKVMVQLIIDKNRFSGE
jgi:hypothetical protein